MKTSNLSPRPRRTDPARRAQLLAAFDRSGMSAAAFARQRKINYTTFCGWRQQRRVAESPQFVQVEVSPSAVSAELVIELGPQARLRIGAASQIALAAQLLQSFNGCRPC